MHTCQFCGWSREAATPVVLPAGCPTCGCAVDSEPRTSSEQRALAALASVSAPRIVSRPVVLALTCLFALCFALAAARVGYLAGDTAGAITGIGIAGFLLLPLVPERVGDARPRTR